MLGDSITRFAVACDMFRAANTAVEQEYPPGLPRELAYVSRIETFNSYLLKLYQECRDAIPLFDVTTKACMEQSRIIRTILRKQQSEQFVPSVIPNEEQLVSAAQNAGLRCQLAMISLLFDLGELRSAGHPFDAVFRSSVEIFRLYDYAALLKCKTITFMLDFMADIARDVIRITRSTREKQLERMFFVVTGPYQNP